MEAPNPAQGRLRDRTDEALVLTGKSETYVKAGEIGQLYVPYDENGWPIEGALCPPCVWNRAYPGQLQRNV